MRRITFLFSDFTRLGGAERIGSILIKDLNKYYNCKILSNFRTGNLSYQLEENIEIEYLNSKQKNLKAILLTNIYKIREYIKKNKIDILIIMARDNNIMPLLAKVFTNTKIIFCEHNAINSRKVFYKRNIKEIIYAYFFQKAIIYLSDKIVVLTEKEKNIYLNQYNISLNKLIVIPNMLDKKLLEIGDTYKYDLSSKKIITVGRIDFQKGYEYLVEIAKVVFTKHPDWSWDIYGKGDDKYKNELIDLVKKYNLENNVFFKGTSSNIYEIYKQYSFFVMTSRYEGLPMVLLEAKSVKLPVISFDIESGPSEIIDNNINGFLVNPFSISEMSNKINKLIENPELRQKFSDNSYNNIEKFKPEKVIKQWQELIDSL